MRSSHNWWMNQTYWGPFRRTANDVRRAFGALFSVFDPQWQSSHRSQHHRLHDLLDVPSIPNFSKLFSLGQDALDTQHCPGFSSVRNNLRSPSEFFSARLELEVGARFARANKQPEFHSKLPKGRKPDLRVGLGSDTLYVEVKMLEDSWVARQNRICALEILLSAESRESVAARLRKLSPQGKCDPRDIQRLLNNSVAKAVNQLPADFPGLVVLYSHPALDPQQVSPRVRGCFADSTSKFARLVALFFRPLGHWGGEPFEPFEIWNPTSKADSIQKELAALLCS